MKIGIVEDEVIIADTIAALLQELGYIVCEPCGNYDEALKMLAAEQPDLVLLDIQLARSQDGIEIARHIRANYAVPFIFLTANSDAATLELAKKTRPDGYIVKPFQKQDIYAAIEIALYNFSLQNIQSLPVANNDKNTLFIKEGQHYHKVSPDDILYLSSDHVYVTVHTAVKKFLVRASMQEYLTRFDSSKFIRIHRSYAVNINKIDKINSVYLIVSGEQLPVSRNYKEHLMGILNVC